MLGDPQDLFEAVGPSTEGEAIHCNVDQVMFDNSSATWHPALMWTIGHAGCFGG